MPKREPYDHVRQEIQHLWEHWPDRIPRRSHTLNMFAFYNWLSEQRPDLARFSDASPSRDLQQVKAWLIEYEEQQGRSIF